MIDLQQIREKLQQAIKESDLNQSKLADAIHVHHSIIGQYLSGRSMPALDTFANICEILDLDANEILCIHKDKF